MLLKTLIGAAVIAAGVTTSAAAADISGAGATFPFPIYAKWADSWKKDSGSGLNYQSIGSGAGIKQIKAKTVTFGATDAPLKAKDLDEAGLAQFPMVMGGIVPVVHYLSKVSPDWQAKIGEAPSVEWPLGIGAKGNDGVASNVAGTEGAIGYVEYAYAKQNKLAWADMMNAAGKRVAPTVEAFQAAAASADWAKAPGFYMILTNQPDARAWPLTAATFILMYKKPVDVAASNTALKFFTWAYEKGDAEAKALDYIPMPENVVALVKKMWASDIAQK
jgi:phosphate transport system substrate-binding protein